MSRELKQLKKSDITTIRNDILKKQNGLCAISKVKITDETGYSLDHQHKFLRETNGEDGAGCIRGVLSRNMNVLEGKIWNNTSRYLKPKNVQERIDFLKSLVAYYEQGTYDLIHPDEKVKEKILSKKNYNKLKKAYSLDIEKGIKKRKFPEYPKSKKATKALILLFKEYNIDLYN